MSAKGGRPSTGSIFFEGGIWKARVTLPDGSRKVFKLPAWFNEEQARAKAAELAHAVKRHGVEGIEKTPIPKSETVAEYAKRWCDAREARGVASVIDDRARLKHHVEPVIGDLEIRIVKRDDVERLIERLDAKARAGRYEDAEGNRRSFNWKTATLTWSNVRSLFRSATNAKDRSLRVREDDPCVGVAGPDRGVHKSKVYLYPSEFAALVACEDVPVRWRRLFSIAGYVYARAGELEALQWEDVDLENGVIHIHRSVDRVRNKGRVKSTKGKAARRVPIERELLPLLYAMHEEARGDDERASGPVLDMPSPGVMSAKLRHYLKAAGVKRADLFIGDATRKRITFHDLRSTGATWAAVRGDEPLRIMQRCGHKTFSTTMLYVREAENLGHNFGAVFPALPSALWKVLPGVSASTSSRYAYHTRKTGRSSVGVTGFEPVTSTV